MNCASVGKQINFDSIKNRINSKNSIQEEIRLRIHAGNRSLFANKKLLNNKDLNAASKLQIYKSIIRPTVTYAHDSHRTKSPTGFREKGT